METVGAALDSFRRVEFTNGNESLRIHLTSRGTHFGVNYSDLRDSAGSICAARVAGTVPKITPTRMDADKATTTDHTVIGGEKSVKMRIERGMVNPTNVPTSPPVNEMMMASVKN